MKLDKTTTISPVDGRYGEQTKQLTEIFSEYGLMKYRLLIEIEWLIHLSNEKSISQLPKFSNNIIRQLFYIHKNFSSKDVKRIKSIEKKTNHDVKAVEYYLKEKISTIKKLNSHKEFIHFGCTSEDINNLSYALMVKDTSKIFLEIEFLKLTNLLRKKAHQYASVAMLSRTHGQAATPTTLGKEFANFLFRIERISEVIKSIKIRGKINGAVGNYNAHIVAYPKADWEKISKSFVTKLGLAWSPYTTQVEPKDALSKLFHSYLRINNVLIDLSRDMWGYISLGYFSQKTKSGEVGSSTMPHKINPIDFENAEGNLGISNSNFIHLTTTLNTSRWQRDLSDSTVMRNIGVAFAHILIALNSLNKGLKKININKYNINKDLITNYQVITEAIQTVMRKYGLPESYEKMKSVSRGKKLEKEDLHKFISELDIPGSEKTKLYNLSPSDYLGLAIKLARNA